MLSLKVVPSCNIVPENGLIFMHTHFSIFLKNLPQTKTSLKVVPICGIEPALQVVPGWRLGQSIAGGYHYKDGKDDYCFIHDEVGSISVGNTD